MPQRLVGGDSITDNCLKLLGLGKRALLRPRPDHGPIDPHVKHSSCARDQKHSAGFLLKRGEQLLRKVSRPQQPTALNAIFDGDNGFGGQPLLLHQLHFEHRDSDQYKKTKQNPGKPAEHMSGRETAVHFNKICGRKDN